ncbi:MAG: STAS domain-containing protein [Terracidiphilus sp.]
MVSDMCRPTAPENCQTLEPGELTEFVRGNEQRLIERVLPMVRTQSVALDLRFVERIDAAGLAALIKLYTAARDAGHTFTVVNPKPHVAEILSLVGLNALLLPRSAGSSFCPNLRLQQSAA